MMNAHAMLAPMIGRPLSFVSVVIVAPICPTCGTAASLGEQFCAICGGQLPETPAAEPVSSTTVPALDEATADDPLAEAFRAQFEAAQRPLPPEWRDRLRRLAAEAEEGRRLAAVACVDLASYVAHTEALSEQQRDELLQWLTDVVRTAVERRGGFVVKLTGDGALSVFGAPFAFGRDTDAALRAMLEIRQRVLEKNTFAGRQVRLRIGVHFGLTDVRLTEDTAGRHIDVFGDGPNLAARLESAAQADSVEILVSSDVVAQVADTFVFGDERTVQQKRHDRPVVARSLQGENVDGASRILSASRPPLIGRSVEWGQLEHSYGDAAGRFMDVEFVGAGGAGKSRLAREWALHLMQKHGARVGVAACEPHDNLTAFRPGAALVRSLLVAVTDSSNPEESLAALQTPELEELIPVAGYLLGVAPHVQAVGQLPGERLRAILTALLPQLCLGLARSERPLVLLLDDAAWADAITHDALERLRAAAPPHTILLTTRPQGMATTAMSPASRITMEVAPLAKPAAEELLKHLTRNETLHPGVIRRMLDAADGLPYLLIQLTQDGIGFSAFTGTDATRMLTDSALQTGGARAGLPLLQARLDRLKPNLREVLRTASVLGRTFNLEALQHLIQEPDQLAASVGELVAHRYIDKVSTDQGTLYSFASGALRDAAYANLKEEDRRRLHAAAGAYFADPSAAQRRPFDAAHHLVSAGAGQAAVPHVLQAARQAMDTGAAEAAYSLLSQCIQAIGSDGVDSQERLGALHEAAGRAARALGDLQRADEHFSAAARSTNPLRQAMAQFHRGVNAQSRSQWEEALGNFKSATQLGQTLPDGVAARQLRGRILIARGGIDYRNNRRQNAETAWSETIQLTEGQRDPVLDALRGDALTNLCLVALGQGDLHAAERHGQAAADHWRTIGNSYGAVNALVNLGLVQQQRGRWQAAAASFQQAESQAAAIGHFYGLSAAQNNLADLDLFLGRAEQAVPRARAAVRSADLAGHAHSRLIALQTWAMALAATGDTPRARTTMERALSEAAGLHDETAADSCRLGLAWIYLNDGALEPALPLLSVHKPGMDAAVDAWLLILRDAYSSLLRGKTHRNLQAEALRTSGAGPTTKLQALDAAALLLHRDIDGAPTRAELQDLYATLRADAPEV